MCAALPWEAKVAFWKINKAFGSQLLTREKVKSFLKNSSGSWQGFQRRVWRLQDASPTPYIFLPMLSFFFFHSLSPSYYSCFLLSFLLWCFGLPKWGLPFLLVALSSDRLPVLIHQDLNTLLGGKTQTLECSLGFQRHSATFWNLCNGHRLCLPPSFGDGNHAFHGGKVPSCCGWFWLKCQSSVMWSEHAIPLDSGIGLRQWSRANQSASGGQCGRQAGRTMGSYVWGWSKTQQRSQRQGTDGAPGSRKEADHSLSPRPLNPVLFHHMSHCGFPPLN